MKAELEYLRISRDDSSDNFSRIKGAYRTLAFNDRRQHILHRGPAFLARTLKQRPLEKRRSFLLVKAYYHNQIINS